MAASVRIEDAAFADPRIELLGSLMGTSKFDAIGRLAYIWRYCTDRQTHVVPVSIVALYVEPQLLVNSALAEQVGSDSLRIRGTKGRIEWLAKLRKNARKGGRAKAAKRHPSRQIAADPEGNPDVCPPAPAPAPAPAKRSGKTSSSSEVAAATSYFLEGFNSYFDQSRRPKAWLDDVRKALAAGFSASEMRGAAWGAKQRYADSPDVVSNFKPSTILRLKSREGKTTLPQWLELADEVWHELNPGKPAPWWSERPKLEVVGG